MRLTKFSIETFGNKVFGGFTQDEYFNGWACPYFTFEQAQSVLEAQQQISSKAFYNEVEDSFIFNLENEDESEVYNAVSIEGRKLYPIGTFSWIWEEVE